MTEKPKTKLGLAVKTKGYKSSLSEKSSQAIAEKLAGEWIERKEINFLRVAEIGYEQHKKELDAWLEEQAKKLERLGNGLSYNPYASETNAVREEIKEIVAALRGGGGKK